MVIIDTRLQPAELLPKINKLWDLSAAKILSVEKTCTPDKGSPVFTVLGRYTALSWTEWTQGFQFGSSLLQFDATNERKFLDIGREKTFSLMSNHLTHMGVHDHGFNNVSTYGNLWRLMAEGRLKYDAYEMEFYKLALKCSGAVQARRWSRTADPGTGGFIYSFNGPHSLFSDTMRTLRALALAHLLGQTLMEENDHKISLLLRLVQHASTTAKYAVYYGEGRDAYDIRGRVAHESLFNPNDGNYRCASTQQGYSPFTTWTRGLAWVMLGFAEQLEFLSILEDKELKPLGGRKNIEAMMLKACQASCDFYLANTPTDGIPYWDTGAPGLMRLGNYLNKPAEPVNPYEPVDSSAAAIGAQGLLRLGRYLSKKGRKKQGQTYWQAGLTVAHTLFQKPYLSTQASHQGLILHSIYHRPRGWDHQPIKNLAPYGESSMWGDYHARELALYIQRAAKKQKDYTFFGTGE